MRRHDSQLHPSGPCAQAKRRHEIDCDPKLSDEEVSTDTQVRPYIDSISISVFQMISGVLISYGTYDLTHTLTLSTVTPSKLPGTVKFAMFVRDRSCQHPPHLLDQAKAH